MLYSQARLYIYRSSLHIRDHDHDHFAFSLSHTFTQLYIIAVFLYFCVRIFMRSMRCEIMYKRMLRLRASRRATILYNPRIRDVRVFLIKSTRCAVPLCLLGFRRALELSKICWSESVSVSLLRCVYVCTFSYV